MNRIGRNYLDIYSIHSCAVCTGACLCRCRCHRRRHYVCTEIRVCEMMNATPTKFKLKYLIYTEKLHVLSIGWHGRYEWRCVGRIEMFSVRFQQIGVDEQWKSWGRWKREKKKHFAIVCIDVHQWVRLFGERPLAVASVCTWSKETSEKILIGFHFPIKFLSFVFVSF